MPEMIKVASLGIAFYGRYCVVLGVYKAFLILEDTLTRVLFF